jgi:hypothetical protein
LKENLFYLNKRHELWLKAEKEIQAHNKNRKSNNQGGGFKWKMALNKFADMTLAEKQAYLGAKPVVKQKTNNTKSVRKQFKKTGTELDWRTIPGKIKLIKTMR